MMGKTRDLADISSGRKVRTINSRNKVQNADSLSQGTSTRSGMSSTIYTGNGVSQSIATGVDMATGNFGGLVWTKGRSNTREHIFTDTLRGASLQLRSNSTDGDVSIAGRISSFDATGFSIGSDLDQNADLETYVSWSWQTTKQATGTTSSGKPYTAHYNPDMNFSIVGYEGDGLSGHEIPHHLGVVPELTLFKNRDIVDHWPVKTSLLGIDDSIYLNLTNAAGAQAGERLISSIDTLAIGTAATINGSTNNHIAYNFASKSGVCKIGKYVGTGAAGNYVSTEVDGGDAFKPSFLLVKNLTTAQNWVIHDSIRSDERLYPNLTDAGVAANDFDFTDTGFVHISAGANTNELDSEYIFMAFAETSIDTTKALTDYDYATTPDTISITDQTLVSLANGFDANGQVDTQYQFGAGITQTYGVGFESKKLYMYTDKTGALGTTEVRPLSGITRDDADKYGEVSPSDKTLRTTDKHFDYESVSGVVLASGEQGASYAWNAFAKNTTDFSGGSTDSWLIASITTSSLQYKHTEKRILKSWRFVSELVARQPKRFTIEGSTKESPNTWVEIDATYKASTGIDYVGKGTYLWGDLQNTSANTTPYDYHRINITANNGDATYTGITELEFNTIIASDYYLIEEGKMYGADNVVIERIYLGEFSTDSVGDIINTTIVNYQVSGQEVTSMTVHKDLTVYGEANGRQFATAWVNFDGSQNPPLIRDSFNVADVVDIGVGHNKIIFETPMDNIGYICDSSQYISGIYTLGLGSSYIPTKDALTLRYGGWTGAAASDAAPSDAQNITVVFYGGKKLGGNE